MGLEADIRQYIDETMTLEAETIVSRQEEVDMALMAGLNALTNAILMVARRVDAMNPG